MRQHRPAGGVVAGDQIIIALMERHDAAELRHVVLAVNHGKHIDGEPYSIVATKQTDQPAQIRFWHPTHMLTLWVDQRQCNGTGCREVATYRATDADDTDFNDKYLCNEHARQNVGNGWNLLVLTEGERA